MPRLLYVVEVSLAAARERTVCHRKTSFVATASRATDEGAPTGLMGVPLLFPLV